MSENANAITKAASSSTCPKPNVAMQKKNNFVTPSIKKLMKNNPVNQTMAPGMHATNNPIMNHQMDMPKSTPQSMHFKNLKMRPKKPQINHIMKVPYQRAH